VSEQSMGKRAATRAGHEAILPAGWPRPRGYANGIRARGEMVFVGGMVGWDAAGRFADGLAAQTRQALANILAVLKECDAGPETIVRMTWYVTDMALYRSSLAEIGAAYRDVMGRSYPAMALVEVKSLVEPKALVEIEATAVLPEA